MWSPGGTVPTVGRFEFKPKLEVPGPGGYDVSNDLRFVSPVHSIGTSKRSELVGRDAAATPAPGQCWVSRIPGAGAQTSHKAASSPAVKFSADRRFNRKLFIGV